MEKAKVTPSIVPMEISNIHISKETKEAAKSKLKELIQSETRLVRGIFQCFETPGATVPITVIKYPGVKPFKQALTDGYTYEIPLYVARFLNGIDVSAGALGDANTRNTNIGTCSYTVHGFKSAGAGDLAPSAMGQGPDGQGGIPVPIVGPMSRKKRFGFQSMEFAGDGS